MPYTFFCSYAHSDSVNDDEVKQFFELLHVAVKRELGCKNDVGFFDAQNLQLGVEWDSKIELALRTSQVLVCLVSNYYVNSDWCRREFEVFRQRVDAYLEANPGVLPRLIIPLIWYPVRGSLPIEYARFQYTHGDLPPSYRDMGIQQMRCVSICRDDFVKLVRLVAKSIVDAAQDHPMPDAAFITPYKQVTPPDRPATARGPRCAKFFYVAPDVDEVDQQRHPERYDHGSYWWRPYRPPEEKHVGHIATEIALNLTMEPHQIDFEPELVTAIEAAAAQNAVVSVIVDPCSLEIDRYKNAMVALDCLPDPNIAVLIPVYEEREERRSELESLVRKTFVVRSETSREEYFRFPIYSYADFESRLRQTLVYIRGRILQRGQSVRPIRSRADVPRVSAVTAESHR